MIFRIRKVCFCQSVSLVFKNENALKTWLKQIVNIDLFNYCSQIIWNEKKTGGGPPPSELKLWEEKVSMWYM